MAKVRISGKEYNLWLGMWAMEQIENRFGDLQSAFKAFKKERKISMVKFMFAALANNGRKKAGLPMDVTEDALDNCNLADLDRLSIALGETMEEALHSETVGGEADEEERDALAAEYDEKNG